MVLVVQVPVERQSRGAHPRARAGALLQVQEAAVQARAREGRGGVGRGAGAHARGGSDDHHHAAEGGGCRGLTALSLCLCVVVQISLKRLRQHMMLCKPQRFLEDTVGSVSLNGDAVYMYEICGDSAVSAAAGFLHTLMIEK